MDRGVINIATCALLALVLTPIQATSATKITFLYVPGGAFAGSYVAQDQGFFAKHGLDVDLSLAASGGVVAAALVGNSAQIGAVAPTQLLQADEQGLDLIIVAGTLVYPAPAGTVAMVARNDSGIKDVKDLVAKKIGVPGFGSPNDVQAKKWVQLKGVDYRTVNWVEVQFPQMGDALKADLVDAVAASIPFVTRILDSKVGYDIGDFSSAAPPGSMVVGYATTRSWFDNNRPTVEAFRSALGEADAFVNDQTHIDSTRASIAKYSKLPPQATASMPLASNYDSHATAESIGFWIDTMREQGLIKGRPDPVTIIEP